MNFTKGHNVFSDIPGYDASKGERIVNALQKLCKKIEYLEQTRNSERKSRSEVSSSSKDEDLTVTDVQYKLLILQLQYARSILKKKHDKSYEVLDAKIRDSSQDSLVFGKKDFKKDELHKEFGSTPISEETENRNNLVDESYPVKDSGRYTRVFSENKLAKAEHPCENSVLQPQKTSSSSKPHYHLKLDDVPFLLGASSTASHSVVANVQNIIAMMKTHNKALCGPSKHSATRSAVNPEFTHTAETHLDGRNSQEATKMLNELSKDLCELALKQQKLVKSIDAAQAKNEISNVTKNVSREDSVNKIINKHAGNTNSRKRQSKSESEIKLHAEVKNLPKVKEIYFVKSNVQPKQSSSNVRSQTSNISIMDRRKLLRSLQNFKSHLSEEDISWD